MARPEIRALLAAPVGRAVLAELLDVDRLRLLPDIHEWPPEDVLDRACVAAAARLEELARTDDPVALLTGVARAIANWWFNPVEQMSVPHLAAAADALGTVAEAVVRSPAASWWWEPVDQHTQGWVGWAGATSPARGDELTGAIIQATAEEDESEARAAADPTWPPPPGVRTSGTWWSLPLGAGIVSTTRECFGVLPAVGIGCRQEWLGDQRVEVWALNVAPEPRVYEVRMPEDWARLTAAYPRDVTASRRRDWYRWTGREGTLELPNWSAVAREWDGVHLSVGGFLTASGVPLDVGRATTLLAGWDPDQTVWFRDVFRDERRLAPWQGQPGWTALERARSGP